MWARWKKSWRHWKRVIRSCKKTTRLWKKVIRNWKPAKKTLPIPRVHFFCKSWPYGNFVIRLCFGYAVKVAVGVMAHENDDKTNRVQENLIKAENDARDNERIPQDRFKELTTGKKVSEDKAKNVEQVTNSFSFLDSAKSEPSFRLYHATSPPHLQPWHNPFETWHIFARALVAFWMILNHFQFFL